MISIKIKSINYIIVNPTITFIIITNIINITKINITIIKSIINYV